MMTKKTDIIFAYGLSDDETAAAVRATIAARDGDVRLAALDYIEANPGVPLDIIERAIRECLAR